MRIFLATAKLDDIRWAAEGALADGVVTTPALLTAEGANGDARDLLADICRSTSGPVCATVAAIDAADMYREGREMAKIGDNLVAQLPLVEDATGAIRRLSAEGVRVAATLVFNAAQALLAAKAGAAMVNVSIDELDAYGHNGAQVVAEISSVFDAHGIECDVMAASPRSAAQFTSCALAGAHVAVVTPAVARTLLLHPLTDRGVDQLLSELSKRPKVRVAP